MMELFSRGQIGASAAPNNKESRLAAAFEVPFSPKEGALGRPNGMARLPIQMAMSAPRAVDFRLLKPLAVGLVPELFRCRARSNSDASPAAFPARKMLARERHLHGLPAEKMHLQRRSPGGKNSMAYSYNRRKNFSLRPLNAACIENNSCGPEIGQASS
jgi:hypothetical protein